MALEINKIHCGDCLELMPQIEDKSIDMILCDLPYGTTACKWDTVIPFEPLWEQYKRIIKDNGAVVLFGSEPFSSYLRMSNIKDYRYDWKWDKVIGSGSLNVRYMPLKRYEDVIIFYKKTPTYNPQMVLRDKTKLRPCGQFLKPNETYGLKKKEQYLYDEDYKYPDTKLEYHSRENELNSKHKIHPTQKPVALLEYLIKTYTNEGETVLDNCIGAGTTAIACKNTNRNFIGIEQEQKYVDIANERLNGTQLKPKSFEKN
jgi:site-specific DNA-methyltransferase (adenine-specific)